MFNLLMNWMRDNKILPQISDTERQALEAGDVWIDGQFFGGKVDFESILAENYAALQKLKRFEKPFICLFSDKDQVAPKGYHSVRPIIPGTQDYEPIILKGGSHFLLEDVPEDYAREVLMPC